MTAGPSRTRSGGSQSQGGKLWPRIALKGLGAKKLGAVVVPPNESDDGAKSDTKIGGRQRVTAILDCWKQAQDAT